MIFDAFQDLLGFSAFSDVSLHVFIIVLRSREPVNTLTHVGLSLLRFECADKN